MLADGHGIRTIARHLGGWLNYYGRYYRTALHPLLKRINYYLMRWLRRKYKRLRGIKAARRAWQRITIQYPLLFAHWAPAVKTRRAG